MIRGIQASSSEQLSAGICWATGVPAVVGSRAGGCLDARAGCVDTRTGYATRSTTRG
jgi:hypothetical protein